MLRSIVAAAVCASLAACTLGPSAARHPLGRYAGGAEATLRTAGTRVSGELLEVQDTALLVLRDGERLTLVPYRLIRDGRVRFAAGSLRNGGTPDVALRQRLRRFSRFPQGVGMPLLQQLLTIYGQPAVDVIGG
jgi:hypothetical protein